jgi:hypothetical protein
LSADFLICTTAVSQDKGNVYTLIEPYEGIHALLQVLITDGGFKQLEDL